MTSQNQTGKDAKNLSTPERDAVVKPAESSQIARELTDEEIAAVAGGIDLASPKKQ
jgi:hypothetical protein